MRLWQSVKRIFWSINMGSFDGLIYGKSVALVGPAAYIVGSNFGDEIDSHDVVVRLNRGIECVEEHSDDVGFLTDVLYSCLIEKPANAGKIDPEYLSDCGIRYVVAPPHSDFQGISYATRFHELVNLNTVNKICEDIPVRIIDHTFHTEIARAVGCKPNTGFLAIYDLLRFNPSRLSVYGFSFYLDGFVSGIKSGVEEEQNLTEDQFADKCFNSKRHVQKNMWKYAKETLLDNSVVGLDPVLDYILNMNDFSKDDFLNYENLYSDKKEFAEGSSKEF